MRPVAGPGRRGVVEALRLIVIVFGAGIGHQVGSSFTATGSVLGPFDGTVVGILVGTGVGYVLGGVLGRTTLITVERTASSLRDVSAETLVAGGVGAASGSLLGGALAWPVFLIPDPFLSLPLFAFVVIVLGLVGHRLALSRKRDVIEIVGGRGGLSPRPVPAALRERILDTSVAIDGRLLAVVRAGFFGGTLTVPAFVLTELQGLADAGDAGGLRRQRGRRGLETLEALRREPTVELEVLDLELPAVAEVDAKLVRLCLDREAALLTLDTNLARAAGLAGVDVMNFHALTLALRPPVAAGDEVVVLLTKAGKEPGQAIGYLDDGTMVVAERSRSAVGSERAVRVTSVLTTANGRMVFAEPEVAETVPRPAPAETRPAPAAPQPPPVVGAEHPSPMLLAAAPERLRDSA